MQDHRKSAKTPTQKGPITPEGYLVNFVKDLEDELNKKTKETDHYMSLCNSLKKKLVETESVKTVLYNYLNLQKKLSNDSTREQAIKNIQSSINEPVYSTIKKAPKLSETESKLLENQETLKKYNDLIEGIRTLLRSRYQEIEFFDAKDLYSDDPVKLLTVIKLIVDNYRKIKEAYEQLHSSVPDPRAVLEKHEILIGDIIKFGSDVEELIHDSEDINTVRRFSKSYNYILDLLVQGIRRILPDPSLNIGLVNKINQIKQKHSISYGEIVDKLTGTMESREVYLKKLENLLNTSINPILTYILFDPFKKSLSRPPDDYNMPHVEMGSEKHKYLSEIEVGINAFLLKLQKGGRTKFAESIKEYFDLNLKLQSDYDEISAGVDRLLSKTHGEQLKGQTLMEKLQIIENQVLDTSLANLEIRTDDMELQISQEDLNKYVNFAIEKLAVALQKGALVSDLDSDTIVTMNTVVASFKSILEVFSKTPLEIGEEMTKKLDQECSEFVKNIDKSTTSLSNKFKQLKETIMGFEKKDFKNNVEIEELKTEQLIMLNKIQELQEEIQQKSLNEELNAHMLETTNKVAEVCETVMKYSTDLMNQGLIMRRAQGQHKKLSSSDSDFDADNLNVDDMLKLTDQYLDETPDAVQDEQLASKEAESAETARKREQLAVDLFSRINRLEEASESLVRLNASIMDSKKKYESDDILRSEKISDLIKSLTIYSETADIKSAAPITTSEHLRLGESASLKSKDITSLYRTNLDGSETLKDNRAQALLYPGMPESKSLSTEIEPDIVKNLEYLQMVSNDLLQLNTALLASKKAIEDSSIARNSQVDTFVQSLSIYSQKHIDPDHLEPQIETLNLKSLSDASKHSINLTKLISDSQNNLNEHERSVDEITKKLLEDTQLFSTQNKQHKVTTGPVTPSDVENLLACNRSLKGLNDQIFKSRSISEINEEFRNREIETFLDSAPLVSAAPKSDIADTKDLNNKPVLESLMDSVNNSNTLNSSLLDSSEKFEVFTILENRTINKIIDSMFLCSEFYSIPTISRGEFSNLDQRDRSFAPKRLLDETQLFSKQKLVTQSDFKNVLTCITSLKGLNDQIFKSRSIFEINKEFRNAKIETFLDTNPLVSVASKSDRITLKDIKHKPAVELFLDACKNSNNLNSSLLDSIKKFESYTILEAHTINNLIDSMFLFSESYQIPTISRGEYESSFNPITKRGLDASQSFSTQKLVTSSDFKNLLAWNSSIKELNNQIFKSRSISEINKESRDGKIEIFLDMISPVSVVPKSDSTELKAYKKMPLVQSFLDACKNAIDLNSSLLDSIKKFESYTILEDRAINKLIDSMFLCSVSDLLPSISRGEYESSFDPITKRVLDDTRLPSKQKLVTSSDFKNLLACTSNTKELNEQIFKSRSISESNKVYRNGKIELFLDTKSPVSVVSRSVRTELKDIKNKPIIESFLDASRDSINLNASLLDSIKKFESFAILEARAINKMIESMILFSDSYQIPAISRGEYESSFDPITKRSLDVTQSFSTQKLVTSSDFENLLSCTACIRELNDQIFKSRTISEINKEYRNEKIESFLDTNPLVSMAPKSDRTFLKDLINNPMLEQFLDASKNSNNLNSSLLDSIKKYESYTTSKAHTINNLIDSMLLCSESYHIPPISQGEYESSFDPITKSFLDATQSFSTQKLVTSSDFDNLQACNSSIKELNDQVLKSRSISEINNGLRNGKIEIFLNSIPIFSMASKLDTTGSKKQFLETNKIIIKPKQIGSANIFGSYESESNKMVDIKHDAVELYSQYQVPEIQKGPAITREETFRELQKSTYDSMILNMSIENSKTQYEDEEVVKNEFIDRGIKMIFLHSIIGYTSFKHLQKSTINDVDFKNAENTLNDSSILNLSILRSKTVSEDHENLKSKKVDMFTDSMVLISPIDSRVTEEYNQQPVESRRFVTLASITESSRILNSVMLRSRYKCKWNEGIKNVLIDKLIQPTFLCTLSPKSRGVMTSHGSLTGTNITKGMELTKHRKSSLTKQMYEKPLLKESQDISQTKSESSSNVQKSTETVFGTKPGYLAPTKRKYEIQTSESVECLMHFCDHIITSRMKFEYHEVDKNKIVDIRLENVDLYSQYKLPEIQTGSTIDRELALGVLRRETTDSMIFNILIEDSKTKYEEDEIFKNDIIDRDIKAIVLHPMMGYSSFKHLQKSTINDVDFKKAENTLNDLSILNSSILKSKTISEDSENLKSKKVDKFTDSMVLISPIDSGVTEESNQQPLGSRQFATLACITESSGTLNSVMLRSRYKFKWHEGIKNVLIDNLTEPTLLCTLSPQSGGFMASQSYLSGMNGAKGLELAKCRKFPLTKQLSEESEQPILKRSGLLTFNDLYLKNRRFSDPGVQAESLDNFLPFNEIKASKMFEFQVFEQPEMSKENFVNIHRYVNTGFISDTSNYTSQAIGTAHGEELSKIGKSTKFPLVKQISDESEKRMSPITGLIPANDFYLKNTRFSDPGVSAELLPNFLPLEEIKSSKMFDFHVFEHPELSERTSKDLIQDELLLAIRTKQIKTEKKEYPIYNLEHLRQISNTFIGLNDSFIESKHKFETADEDVNQKIDEYIQPMTLISPTLISKPLGQYASPKLEKLMQVSEIGLNINTANAESITKQQQGKTTDETAIDQLIRDINLFSPSQSTPISLDQLPQLDLDKIRTVCDCLIALSTKFIESRKIHEINKTAKNKTIDNQIKDFDLFSCVSTMIPSSSIPENPLSFSKLNLLEFTNDSITRYNSMIDSKQKYVGSETSKNYEIDELLTTGQLYARTKQFETTKKSVFSHTPIGHGISNWYKNFSSFSASILESKTKSLESENLQNMIIDNFIIPQTEFSWLKSDKLASLNVVHRKSDLEKLKEASVNLIHLTSELLNSKDKSFNNEHLINQNVDEMFDSMTFYSNIDQPRRHEGRRYSNIHSDELLGHTLHMFTKAGGSHFRPSGPVLNF